MDKQDKTVKRRGGRPAGPPSERLSLYLDKRITKEIRDRKKAGEVMKDIVNDILMPSLLGSGSVDREGYVSISTLEAYFEDETTPVKLVERELFDTLASMVDSWADNLIKLAVFLPAHLRDSESWQKTYDQNREEYVKLMMLGPDCADRQKAEEFASKRLDEVIEGALRAARIQA